MMMNILIALDLICSAEKLQLWLKILAPLHFSQKMPHVFLKIVEIKSAHIHLWSAVTQNKKDDNNMINEI